MTPIASGSKPSGAVAMLALIDTRWVLGLAFGIYVLMTAAVGFAVFSALGAGSLTLTDGTDSRVAEADEREPRPRTRITGEAHPATA